MLFPESYCLESEGRRDGVNMWQPILSLAAEIESTIDARIERLGLKGRQGGNLVSSSDRVERGDTSPVRVQPDSQKLRVDIGALELRSDGVTVFGDQSDSVAESSGTMSLTGVRQQSLQEVDECMKTIDHS